MRKFALSLLLALPLMAATVGGDGLYDDPLFQDTFLDLKEDATTAEGEGKTLMIVVEQNGCPYCQEFHDVNMARDDIRAEIEANFYPIQLDLWGSREVTDFDGEVLEERDFVAKHNVQFTPTSLFYNAKGEELFRLPGYFKPFHHLAVLNYVQSGAYASEPFQRYLQSYSENLPQASAPAKAE